MRTLSRFAILFACMSFAANILAESNLSLGEAIDLATQNQPVLQSYDQASYSAREAAISSGQLPDPRLKLGIVNLPITGADTGRFSRDDMTMSTIGVMQEMVPRAKREAASRTMEAAADQYQTEKSATALSIQRDVALAWLDVYEAQRRTELYQRILDEATAERSVMTSRVSSGNTELSEVLKQDIEISMLNDKRLTILRDERKARAALARWIGSAADRTLSQALPVMTHPMDSKASSNSLENHPLLRNAHEQEEVALSEVDAAKAGRELNWNWEVMYGKRRADLSDMVTFQIAMDIPWDRPKRQDRQTSQKMLLVDKARSLTEDRRRELAAQLQNAMSDAEIAQARETEHQTRLIPTAQSRLDIAQAGYKAGKQNLSELWQARRGVLEVEMEHWSIMTDMARASVNMDYLLNGQLFQGAQR